MLCVVRNRLLLLCFGCFVFCSVLCAVAVLLLFLVFVNVCSCCVAVGFVGVVFV